MLSRLELLEIVEQEVLGGSFNLMLREPSWIYSKGKLSINLTQVFGKGNEPSLEEMDNMTSGWNVLERKEERECLNQDMQSLYLE